jgi:hypothetical protein
MEHSRHVFRVLLVLLVATATIVLGRGLLVPRSYGAYGPYRFDNVAEQRAARRPLHGGADSCAACHGERLAALRKGAHRTVSCEVCHAPLGLHVRDGAKIAAMRVDRSYGLCARCHRKIDGRPAAVKQVVLEQHVQGALGPDACLDCHDPHAPKL